MLRSYEEYLPVAASSIVISEQLFLWTLINFKWALINFKWTLMNFKRTLKNFLSEL